MLALLPGELLLCVAKHLESTADINAIARTSTYCYSLLNPLLYRYDFNYSEYSKALAWAVHMGTEGTIRHWLEASRPITTTPFMTITASIITTQATAAAEALPEAASHRYESIVRLLLTVDGLPVNRRDGRGETALARGVGHETIVRMLLAHPGIDPNARESDGMTPLWRALQQNQLPTLQLLLDADRIDPNESLDGNERSETLLWWAIHYGRIDAVRLLLGHPQLDPNRHYAEPPLWRAACDGNVAMMRLLLADDRVDPNLRTAAGSTPLGVAAYNDLEPEVDCLVAHPGTDVNATDCESKGTPLMIAARRGHEGVVARLLACDGVDIDATHVDDGDTALCRAAQSGRDGIVRMLLATGEANPDHRNYGGVTPLWHATHRGHVPIIKALLETGAVDTEITGASGYTPLLMATAAGSVDGVELLLAAGANPDFTGPWKVTPISIAVRAEYTSIVRLLLASERVNVNCQNLRGKTPLIEAVERGNLEMVSLLLAAKNVDKNITDFGGQTPLTLAERYGDDDIANLIRDRGCARLA